MEPKVFCINRNCRRQIDEGAAYCPHCGASQCPPWGHVEAPPRAYTCPVCGLGYPEQAPWCPHCQYGRTPLQAQESCNGAHPPEPAEFNAVLVSLMWALTVCVSVIWWMGITTDNLALFGLAVLVDIPAFVLAIVLVCTRNNANRINGWVKIGLEILGFVQGFLFAAAVR